MQYHNLTDYRVTPSVLPADKESTVTITPLGEHSRFNDNYVYGVEVWPAEETTDIIGECRYAKYSITPKDGIIAFKHLFSGEQYHTIKIIVPEDLRFCDNKFYQPPAHGRVPRKRSISHPKLYVYSLKEDLMPLTVYKGDFHIHSSGSDGHEDQAGVISNLRKAGYDFSAITDHYVYEPSQHAQQIFADISDVFTILNGEEVHVPNEFIHEVSIGAKESVNAYYYANREKCDAEIEELANTLSIPEGINKKNYASRWWIAEKSKKFGGMPIITHPYWIWNEVYFVPSALNKHLYEHGNYEAFELLNGGCGRETNNMQTAFYFEERAAGIELPIIGSSDSHCTDRKNDSLPTDAYTLVFANDRTWDSLHSAILAKNSVAVEHYEDDENFRVYGSYRLVKYATFLLQNYFPDYISLCDMQGKIMKEYARTSCEKYKHMLGEMKQLTDEFTNKFFGR